MEYVYPIEAQPRQTGFERFLYEVTNAADASGWQPDLGADGHVGRFEFLQDAAEILFRFAVAILHCSVEVVHARFERSRNRALLIERIAAYHQSADRTAAEAQQRQLHSAAPEYPHL